MDADAWFTEHGATLGIKPPAKEKKLNGACGKVSATDYDRWAKYNVDAEEDAMEVKFAKEDFQRAVKATEDLSKEKLVSAGADARGLAEMLSAHAAVEALKASGTCQTSAKSRRNKNRSVRFTGTAACTSSSSPLAVTSASSSSSSLSSTESIDTQKNPTFLSPRPTMNMELNMKQDNAGLIIDKSSIPPIHDSENVINTLSTLMNKTSVTFGELLNDLDCLTKKVDANASEEMRRIRSANDDICAHGLALVQRVDSFIREALGDAKAVETKVIAAGLKSLPQVRSCMQVLARIEEGAQMIWLKTASKTAMCALRDGRFSLAADITRFWLKTAQERGSSDALTALETRKAIADASSTATAIAEGTADNPHRDVGDKGVEEQEQEQDDRMAGPSASMWLLRALSFVGMGSCYLANMHVRQAVRICPTFPGLDKVQRAVDALEGRQMNTLSPPRGEKVGRQERLATEARLICRQLKITAMHVVRLTSAITTQDSTEVKNNDHLASFELHSVTPELLAQLYDPLQEGTVPRSIFAVWQDGTDVNLDTSMNTASCVHIEEELKDSENEGGEDKRTSPGIALSDIEQRLDEIELELSRVDCTRVHFLGAIRELYYQAQLLYLEGMYRSALLKYSAVIFFVFITLDRTVTTHGAVSDGAENINDKALGVREYLCQLQASCLINAASCKAKCQVQDRLEGASHTLRSYHYSDKLDVNNGECPVQHQFEDVAALLDSKTQSLLPLLVTGSQLRESETEAGTKSIKAAYLIELISSHAVLLCHVGLIAAGKPKNLSLTSNPEYDLHVVSGLLRAVEIAVEIHEYNFGLYFLSRACWGLVLGLYDAYRAIMGPDYESLVAEEKQRLHKLVWDKHRARLVSFGALSSSSREANESEGAGDGNGSASGSFVARYPRMQRFSQAFLTVSPLEPLENTAHGDSTHSYPINTDLVRFPRVQDSCNVPVTAPGEVLALLKTVHRQRARLLFKRGRLRGPKGFG